MRSMIDSRMVVTVFRIVREGYRYTDAKKNRPFNRCGSNSCLSMSIPNVRTSRKDDIPVNQRIADDRDAASFAHDDQIG